MTKLLTAKLIGNICILIALVGIAYMFYPLITIYFSPATISEEKAIQGEYIIIPKIHAQAEIIEGIDPWNEATYQTSPAKRRSSS